jgi:hypothetical protein
MRQYRCYFSDKKSETPGWLPLHCENDGAAHDQALGLFAGRLFSDKVEVWEGARMTLSYSRSIPKSPLELRRMCYLAIAAANDEVDAGSKRSIAAGAYALAQQAEVLEDHGG